MKSCYTTDIKNEAYDPLNHAQILENVAFSFSSFLIDFRSQHLNEVIKVTTLHRMIGVLGTEIFCSSEYISTFSGITFPIP